MQSNNDIKKLQQKIKLSKRVIEKDPENHSSHYLLALRYSELEKLDSNDHSLEIKESYDNAIAHSSGMDAARYQIYKASYYCDKQQYQKALDILNNQVDPVHIIQLKDAATNSQDLHARNVAEAIFNAREIKDLINKRDDLSNSLKLVLSKICDIQGAVKATMSEDLYAEYAEIINSFKELHLSPKAIMVKLIKIDDIEEQANMNSTKISALEAWKEKIGQKVIDNSDKIVDLLTKTQSLDKDSVTYARDLSKIISENVEIYDLVFDLQTQLEDHEAQLLEKVNNAQFEEVVQTVGKNKELISIVETNLEKFRNEVTNKLSSNEEMINSLFTKCQKIKDDNEITQQDLSKLISELDEHSIIITDLSEDIDSIGKSSDPNIAEFMTQYQDHSSTINLLIDEMQMLKDSNISHEEKILNIRKKLKTIQINMVSDIIYDNELLNHPDMFNSLASIYGANKVLKLSGSICPSLIDTAIQDQNVDLLLGAIVSLDIDSINH
jgi:hypothetical protein